MILDVKAKNNLTLLIFLVFLPPFLIFSCATSPHLFKPIDSAVEQADFLAALEEIRRVQKGINVIYNERNTISLFLDKGLLEYYAGNYADSSADLHNAEKLIEEAYTKSKSELFYSYIINDNIKEYPGEDFENIYLNVFNALNYYNIGNTEGALIEILKLSGTNGKLDLLAHRYEYTDPATGASLNEMTRKRTGIREVPQTRSVNFSNSALARYLSALFYQAEGNTDSARAEFEQTERAFNSNRTIYYNRIPGAVMEARYVPSGKARLNIISFTGLSPIKEETILLQYLPFQHPLLKIATFRLPDLVSRHSMITRIEVIVENEGRFDLELLEDMGAVIKETFSARYANIFKKTYIRTIIKYAIADTAVAVKSEDSSKLSGFFIALAARLGTDASEGADVRMSRFLPDKAHIGGINLDPGAYSVIINYYNGNNIISSEIRNITVNPDSLNLLQTVNLR